VFRMIGTNRTRRPVRQSTASSRLAIRWSARSTTTRSRTPL
jgi:hypothetical protein